MPRRNDVSQREATMRRKLLRLIGLALAVIVVLGWSATTARGDKKDEGEAPQKGDPEGSSSRFSAAAGKVPEKPDLEKVEISGEIKGKQYHFTLDKD